MRLVMVDNYDSFTFNLVQYLMEFGARVDVHRNDATSVTELLDGAPFLIGGSTNWWSDSSMTSAGESPEWVTGAIASWYPRLQPRVSRAIQPTASPRSRSGPVGSGNMQSGMRRTAAS